jgi:hypothetical protein
VQFQIYTSFHLSIPGGGGGGGGGGEEASGEESVSQREDEWIKISDECFST